MFSPISRVSYICVLKWFETNFTEKRSRAWLLYCWFPDNLYLLVYLCFCVIWQKISFLSVTALRFSENIFLCFSTALRHQNNKSFHRIFFVKHNRLARCKSWTARNHFHSLRMISSKHHHIQLQKLTLPFILIFFGLGHHGFYLNSFEWGRTVIWNPTIP